MRLCIWEAREILWARAAFDTRAVYDLHVSVIYNWHVALGSEYSVELQCSVGVRELAYF